MLTTLFINIYVSGCTTVWDYRHRFRHKVGFDSNQFTIFLKYCLFSRIFIWYLLD